MKVKSKLNFFLPLLIFAVFFPLASLEAQSTPTFEPLPFHAYDFDEPARAWVAQMRAGTIPEGRPDSRAVALGLVPNTFDGWQTFEYWRQAPSTAIAGAGTVLALQVEMKNGAGWAHDFHAWNGRAWNPNATKEGYLFGALDNSTRFGIGTPTRIREAADKVWALPATAFFSTTTPPPPPPPPTPPPASPPPPPPSGAFAPGDRVRVNTTVNTSLNVRASGSTSAAISCTQPSGSLGTV